MSSSSRISISLKSVTRPYSFLPGRRAGLVLLGLCGLVRVSAFAGQTRLPALPTGFRRGRAFSGLAPGRTEAAEHQGPGLLPGAPPGARSVGLLPGQTGLPEDTDRWGRSQVPGGRGGFQTCRGSSAQPAGLRRGLGPALRPRPAASRTGPEAPAVVPGWLPSCSCGRTRPGDLLLHRPTRVDPQKRLLHQGCEAGSASPSRPLGGQGLLRRIPSPRRCVSKHFLFNSPDPPGGQC